MLFGGAAGESLQDTSSEWLADCPSWTAAELLMAEKKALGFYISGHPLENYAEVLRELEADQVVRLNQFANGSRVSVGAIVTELQARTTKTGNNFAIMRLEDQTGGVKCVCWSDVYNKYGKLLQNDAALLVCCKLELSEDGSVTLIAEEVTHLDGILQQKSRTAVVRVPEGLELDSVLETLFTVLDKNRGECQLFLDFILDDGLMVRVRPHTTLRIQGSLELETALHNTGCRVEWLNSSL